VKRVVPSQTLKGTGKNGGGHFAAVRKGKAWRIPEKKPETHANSTRQKWASYISIMRKRNKKRVRSRGAAILNKVQWFLLAADVIRNPE